MTRTIAIGDIHGGLKALKQLLGRVNVQPTDHLIFMGDYVDGWSESAQLITYLIDLEKRVKCTFILGNHDVWCRNWLAEKVLDDTWQLHGGKSTVTSYANLTAAEKKEHITFFKNMQHFVVDEKNRLFIHAGFTSMHGPEREHYQTMYSWDRTLWEAALAVHTRVERNENIFPKRLKLFSQIFIGHTPTLEWGETTPMYRTNVWNLDTGAAFGGKLSALDIDTAEVWQSDPVHELYPNEKGRN
jgi:serine/threonine protein phosphatase 1